VGLGVSSGRRVVGGNAGSHHTVMSGLVCGCWMDHDHS